MLVAWLFVATDTLLRQVAALLWSIHEGIWLGLLGRGMLHRVAERLEQLDRDLVLAPRRVDAQPSAGQHLHPILGPEMKSTGEVMGTGDTFAEAFAKALLAAGGPPPESGTALISVRDAGGVHDL